MWYPATVTVAAASEPVSLDEAKRQVGVTGTDRDAMLTGLTKAARSFAEQYCGIFIAEQTVEAKCDCFADFERVVLAPLQSVTSITYIDTAGEEQTLSTDVYEVRPEGLAPSIVRKYGQRWPTIQPGSRITVTAVVGYEEVPADLSMALLAIISKHYSLGGRDVSIRSEDVEGIGSRQWGSVDRVAEQLDGSARILLENYRNLAL